MPASKGNKIKRVESSSIMECAEIGMAWAAAICDEDGHEYAGVCQVPRSYYDIQGRPDADAWYVACDEELIKLFDMGTLMIQHRGLFYNHQGNESDGHVFLLQEEGGLKRQAQGAQMSHQRQRQ